MNRKIKKICDLEEGEIALIAEKSIGSFRDRAVIKRGGEVFILRSESESVIDNWPSMQNIMVASLGFLMESI